MVNDDSVDIYKFTMVQAIMSMGMIFGIDCVFALYALFDSMNMRLTFTILALLAIKPLKHSIDLTGPMTSDIGTQCQMVNDDSVDIHRSTMIQSMMCIVTVWGLFVPLRCIRWASFSSVMDVVVVQAEPTLVLIK